MARKLFCELGPTAYRISTQKEILLRDLKDLPLRGKFAREKGQELLPVKVKHHASLIRRRLGDVDMRLQENKAVNLALAAPLVDRVLIRPGEIFSFWRLVGNPTAKRGFREGLVIAGGGRTGSGVGGGMCQFTNLIHWMVLHTDLTIVEHHHHDGVDLFPDFGRVIPFGTGTSILYNYLDYRFCNNTDRTYQLTVWVDDEYLNGEIRADAPQEHSYHIECRDEFFSREADGIYRNKEIWRRKIDGRTGDCVEETLLRKNHAKIAYDPTGLTVVDRTAPEEKKEETL